VRYDYALSYALLSKQDIANQIFQLDEDLIEAESAKLERKLMAARVATNRFVRSAVIRNDNKFNALLAHTRYMKDGLDDAVYYMGNRELHALAKKYGIADTMYYGGDVMISSLGTISEALTKRIDAISNSVFYYNYFETMVGSESVETFRVLFDILEMCWNATDTDSVVGFDPNECLVGINQLETDQNLAYFLAEDITVYWTGSFQQYLLPYEHAISLVYDDTGIDVNVIPEYVSCSLEIQRMNATLTAINELTTLTQTLMAADKNSTSVLYAAASPLRNALDRINTTNLLQLISNINLDQCSWMFDKGMNSDEIAKLETSQSTLQQTKFLQVQCSQWVSNMAKFILDAHEYHVNVIEPLIENVQRYQDNEITMELFSNGWEPVLVEDLRFGYSAVLNNLQLLQIEYDRTCRVLPILLQTTFDYLFDYPLPILNYKILYNLQLWTELVAKSSAPTITRTKERIENDTTWPPDLGGIFQELYEPFFDYPQSLKSITVDGFMAFTRSVRDTQAILADFVQKTNPDDDFFV
jgi:hypothetical protein